MTSRRTHISGLIALAVVGAGLVLAMRTKVAAFEHVTRLPTMEEMIASTEPIDIRIAQTFDGRTTIVDVQGSGASYTLCMRRDSGAGKPEIIAMASYPGQTEVGMARGSKMEADFLYQLRTGLNGDRLNDRGKNVAETLIRLLE